MGKESNQFTQINNTKITQFNNGNSKLNLNIISIPEKYINEKPYFKPKKLSFNENNSNSSKKDNLNSDNKLPEAINQYIDIYSYPEHKVSRKKSSGAETSCTSEECSPQNKITKKSFQHNNKNKKNKIPFKGEAKDFKIKYKTELCKYYEINGYCKYGDKCAYAHGKDNLRSKVTNTTAYRTKKCSQFFEQGYCPYGNRCQFAHQLKSNIINNPYDKGMSYGKILETISKLENVENIKKLVEKPRLNVFKEICSDDNQNIKSRLLDDIKGLSYNNLYKRIDN